jgi:hypothetical protein
MDWATFGTVKGAASKVLPKSMGLNTKNAIELEKSLARNLRIINTERIKMGEMSYPEISQYVDDVASMDKSNLNAVADSVQNGKIGSPLIKPKDYTGQGAKIPSPLKGVESKVDVRPLWQIKQEADAVTREANIEAIINKQKIMQKLADNGSPQAKVYLKRNEKAFDTAWKAKGNAEIKIDREFSSKDVIPEKEASLLPSQRATLQGRSRTPVEEVNVPSRILTPEEIRTRNMLSNRSQNKIYDRQGRQWNIR